ncbi:hypothetical protein GIB67_003871, partial [Kingdonia uniflora]
SLSQQQVWVWEVGFFKFNSTCSFYRAVILLPPLQLLSFFLPKSTHIHILLLPLSQFEGKKTYCPNKFKMEMPQGNPYDSTLPGLRVTRDPERTVTRSR